VERHRWENSGKHGFIPGPGRPGRAPQGDCAPGGVARRGSGVRPGPAGGRRPDAAGRDAAVPLRSREGAGGGGNPLCRGARRPRDPARRGDRMGPRQLPRPHARALRRARHLRGGDRRAVRPTGGPVAGRLPADEGARGGRGGRRRVAPRGDDAAGLARRDEPRHAVGRAPRARVDRRRRPRADVDDPCRSARPAGAGDAGREDRRTHARRAPQGRPVQRDALLAGFRARGAADVLAPQGVPDFRRRNRQGRRVRGRRTPRLRGDRGPGRRRDRSVRRGAPGAGPVASGATAGRSSRARGR